MLTYAYAGKKTLNKFYADKLRVKHTQTSLSSASN